MCQHCVRTFLSSVENILELQKSKGHGFEYHPGNMPVILFHITRVSTEYTVLTHIGVSG